MQDNYFFQKTKKNRPPYHLAKFQFAQLPWTFRNLTITQFGCAPQAGNLQATLVSLTYRILLICTTIRRSLNWNRDLTNMLSGLIIPKEPDWMSMLSEQEPAMWPRFGRPLWLGQLASGWSVITRNENGNVNWRGAVKKGSKLNCINIFRISVRYLLRVLFACEPKFSFRSA